MPEASRLDADRVLATAVRGMPMSATVAIDARSRALAEAGVPVFRLGFGQTPFPVPDSVVEALRRHATAKDYLPVAGLPRLRSAVADHARATAGIAARAEDVVIGPGSKSLMFLLQLVSELELLVPSPSWVSYAPQARLVGRPVRWLETRLQDGWMLDPEVLGAACAAPATRPRLLVLNAPANPTGTGYDEERLSALAAVARRADLLVLSDEIYGPLHHARDRPAPATVSIASHCPERTIVSAGLSKWCGAGGWRLGTFVFPSTLAWLRDAVVAAASETHTATTAPVQHAAVTAYEGNNEIDRYLARSRWILRRLGRWCHARLAGAGIECALPRGGFYLFPRWPSTERDGKAIDGVGWCERILAETGVALLPGSAFGRPRPEHSARLAYVDFDGGAAVDALAASDVRPQGDAIEPFLRRVAPRVVEGIERLAAWSA